MSGRLLLLCPGQGGQNAGMFDLAQQHPRARALLDSGAYSDAVREDIFSNQVAQPTIVTATLAMWEALRDDVPTPVLVAGYSVGELSAYGVAGAIDVDTAVALAIQRAQAMDAAVAQTAPQGIAAVSGLPMAQLRQICATQDCEVAIVTGEESCIVGGLRQHLQALAQAVPTAGGRIELLPVAVASHTSLMAPAVAPFAADFLRARFVPPICPVLSGISAQRIERQDLAADYLSRQLSETIMWSDCMDAATEFGITVVLELGPGAALSRMFAARYPGIACRSVADFRSLKGITTWIDSQMQ